MITNVLPPFLWFTVYISVYLRVFVTNFRPKSHLGLRPRLDLAPKGLESQLSHHLITRLEVFVT